MTRLRDTNRPRRWAVLAAAALVASVAPLAGVSSTSARATPPTDVVVHGTIGFPTGLPGTASTPAPRCVAAMAGVSGADWKIERVTPGRSFSLTADDDAASWRDDFDVLFYEAPPVCLEQVAVAGVGHRNVAGDEYGTVPANATFALVTMIGGEPGSAFTYREFEPEKVQLRRQGERKPTVVAIIETNGYSPYNFDFAGHQHPWNNDDDTEHGINFDDDPATYIPGYPGATPVQLTIPKKEDGNMDVTTLAGTPNAAGQYEGGPDSAAWNSMQPSTSAKAPNLYRFPGTKIVAATRFAKSGSGATYDTRHQQSHGTKTASVSAGNLHGTCPDCVLVLLGGDTVEAFKWATQQRWIDVVSYSIGSLANVPDSTHDPEVTLQAVQSGQSIVAASGNGVDLNFVVPESTYTNQPIGADWVVTVGAVSFNAEQSNGSGRPVDVVSYGSGYRSAGNTTAAGRDLFSGTSNAAPVVAGTIARVIQTGRELLGDVSPGHEPGPDGGIVASGQPRACEGAAETCPLDDGILTRREVDEIVFGNVLPSPPRRTAVTPPGGFSTPGLTMVHAQSTVPGYMAQGHGIVHGRLSATRYEAEQRRFLDVLRGATTSFRRPPGEKSWMTADSKCRQRLYGTWGEGYYETGKESSFTEATDAPGIALDAACTPLPPYTMRPIWQLR